MSFYLGSFSQGLFGGLGDMLQLQGGYTANQLKQIELQRAQLDLQGAQDWYAAQRDKQNQQQPAATPPTTQQAAPAPAPAVNTNINAGLVSSLPALGPNAITVPPDWRGATPASPASPVSPVPPMSRPDTAPVVQGPVSSGLTTPATTVSTLPSPNAPPVPLSTYGQDLGLPVPASPAALPVQSPGATSGQGAPPPVVSPGPAPAGAPAISAVPTQGGLSTGAPGSLMPPLLKPNVPFSQNTPTATPANERFAGGAEDLGSYYRRVHGANVPLVPRGPMNTNVTPAAAMRMAATSPINAGAPMQAQMAALQRGGYYG